MLGVLYSKPLKHWYCGDLIVIIVFGPLLAQFTASPRLPCSKMRATTAVSAHPVCLFVRLPRSCNWYRYFNRYLEVLGRRYCHDAEDYDLSLMPIILPHTLLVEASDVSRFSLLLSIVPWSRLSSWMKSRKCHWDPRRQHICWESWDIHFHMSFFAIVCFLNFFLMPSLQ